MKIIKLTMGTAAFTLLGLTGAAQAENNDAQLKSKIETRIAQDAALKDDSIKVAVDEGKAKLEGTVDNQDEKTRAARIAVAAGAKSVANDLTVEGVAKTEIGAELNDTWITTKVKAELLGDERLRGSDISVDTNQDGIVTLTGTVASEDARKRAVDLAKRIKGVKSVKDGLVLASDRK